MVPIAAHVLEGQAKGLALAGSQRRNTEVDRIGIRAGGLEHAQGNVFDLSDLAQRVFESRVNHRVGDGPVTGVGQVAIDVSDARADKIFRGAHLYIRELQVNGVRVGRSRGFRLAAQQQRDHADHDNDECNSQENGPPVGFAFAGEWRWLDAARPWVNCTIQAELELTEATEGHCCCQANNSRFLTAKADSE